jgi:hypothetical protein
LFSDPEVSSLAFAKCPRSGAPDGKDHWLVVQEVNAGDYTVKKLDTENGMMPLIGKLRVEPNKVTYLGEVNIEMDGCKKMWLSLADQEQRDIKALYEKMPGARELAVDKQFVIESWYQSFRRRLEEEQGEQK